MSSEKEDIYFQEYEQEQRRKLRKKLEQQAAELEKRRKIAADAGTDDLALAARIEALGFSDETAKVFDLLPLVHVAWADGKIQKGERAAIFKVLEQRGIENGTPACQLIESLLEERPTDTYMQESLAVLKETVAGHDDKAESIVDLCVAVAAVSGGFLGFGKTIGDEEKALIEQIAKTFGDETAHHVTKQVGG